MFYLIKLTHKALKFRYLRLLFVFVENRLVKGFSTLARIRDTGKALAKGGKAGGDSTPFYVSEGCLES